MFTLINVIISIVLVIIDAGLTTGLLGLVYLLAVLLPGLAVGVRRLHDAGRSVGDSLTPTDQTRRPSRARLLFSPDASVR